MNKQTSLDHKTSHPKGLVCASLLNSCNMVGLITINALLVLYCTTQLGVPTRQAYVIYAAFGSLFYSMALLGGYLGGKYDYKLAIILGCFLAGAGGYFLAFSGIHFVYVGLACFIVGSGLSTPNVYCLIGKLYAKNDHNRESGFTLSYVINNVGGGAAALVAGYIVKRWGFHTGFIVSSTVVLLSFILFLATYHRLEFYTDDHIKTYQANISWRTFFPMLASILVSLPIITLLLSHAEFSNNLLIILGAAMLLLILYLAFCEKGKNRKRLLAFGLFTTIGVAFWALYMLAPSALIIFIHNNVNKHLWHVTIPTASFLSINPLTIIICGPLLSAFFVWLIRKKRTLSLPAKFSIGIVFMGAGYLMLPIGIYLAATNGLSSLWWIVLSYFLQSFGELFIGPLGYSMVGTLCPVRLEGLMMGTARLSVGVAGAVSAYLAMATASPKHITNPTLTNPRFSHMFGMYGWVTLGIGILIFILIPYFKKLWD